MSRSRSKISMLDAPVCSLAGSVRIGHVVAIDSQERPIVNYSGNPAAPLVARTIVILPRETFITKIDTLQVLLLFEDGNAGLPVIIGVIGDQLLTPNAVEAVDPPTKLRRDVILDGERLVLAGDREIELRCGKSSITLTRDGRVVVKGTEIVSRASRTNKIKGGTVNIN